MSKSKIKSVSIIVLNWNNWDETRNCLESLRTIKFEGRLKVFVIDNNSYDGSCQEIVKWVEKHRVNNKLSSNIISFQAILNKRNLGYAGGNNVGIKLSLIESYDYIWVINNDVVVTEGSLNALIDKAVLGYDVIGSQIRYLDHPDEIWCEGGGTYNPVTMQTYNISLGKRAQDFDDPLDHESKIEANVKYLAGASILFTKNSIEKVGLLTEDYFLYFEEPDWFQRSKKHDMKIGYASRSIIYHGVGRSTDKMAKQNVLGYKMRLLKIRNSIMFGYRFYWWFVPSIAVSAAFRELRLVNAVSAGWYKQVFSTFVPNRYQLSIRFLKFKLNGNLDKELRIIKSYFSGKKQNAVDIGANYGFVSYFFRNTFSVIYAFEPLEKLSKYLKMSNLSDIEVFNFGLSDKVGRFVLQTPFIDGKLDYSYSSYGNVSIKGEVSSVDVDTRRLDDFDFQNIGFIKIDVEGHEYEVLIGAGETIKRWRPVLLIEIEERHNPGGIHKINKLLSSYNYQGFYLNKNNVFDRLENFSVIESQNIKSLVGESSNRYVANFIFVNPKDQDLVVGT